MKDDVVTIRTPQGRLYGRFESHEDAWAAVKRIRRSGHDSLDGVNVVPLIAGVEPMQVHQRWLSDPDEAPAATAETRAAVDTFVGAYNDARSQRRGYRYVSGYLLGSDADLQEASCWPRSVARLTG